MEDNEKKVIQISLNKFIILVILLIVVLGLGIGLYVNALKKSNTESEMQSMNEKENSVNEIKISSDENIAFGIRYNKDFEDMLVEYILSSIREYAKNGSILKSTTGDITAEQLTVEEVNSNNSKYKEKIIEMLTDKEIFKEIYKVDNKDACKYNFEKILNNLGLGTHMGIGTGKTDESGNKVYVYGMTQIDTTTQSSDGNIAIGVRYNKDFEDMLVEYILSSIREYAKNGSILKSTTGDITAEQLTVEEVNSNNSKYKEKIIEMLTDKEIFKDIYKVDNKDACKYNFEKILNNLGLGTHMGTGIGKTDESGNKMYVYGMTQIDTTTQSSGN